MTIKTTARPDVICPGCLVRMIRVASESPQVIAVQEITYRCEKCGTETIRLQKQEK